VLGLTIIEVQHGWWNPEEVELLKQHNIKLLGLGEFNEDPMALSLHPGISKLSFPVDSSCEETERMSSELSYES
jgi:hypothetical protein